MGPTASGKTDVAIQLCQRFPFDVISVDSALVYRGMDIGTAKPGPDTLRHTPHRLIDIRNPDEGYSAGDSFPMQYPIFMSIVWCVVLLAIFIPLGISRYRQAASR